ncbi:phage portal protein [Streptomyces graminilatus]|uniref:phage portal protein n=1 Tax=Streptomyces graminilatus TaxID=1464070 RepID=UPI00099EDF85|nr:phage portal protein [Streptomyces graminilatus]
MDLNLSEEDWATYLSRSHDFELQELQEYNAYYEGTQPLSYMHPELLKEIGEQIRQVVINWPQLVIDAIEERLDVEGFRYPDTDSASDELWRIWQANGMDEKSQQAHTDALVMKRSFLVVGSNPKDATTPLVTAESPLQMYADFDPATRQIRAALKRYNEIDPLTAAVRDRYATLYRPDATVHFKSGGPGTWTVIDRDDHNVGEPLVAVLANRGRLLVPGGQSGLKVVLPVSDAACKMATDLMVGAEFHALPRRAAFGFDEEDFVDVNGKQLSVWSRLAGRIWSTSKTRKEDGADVVQFPAADLANFTGTIEFLARMVAALAALPPNYLGLSADDAASADAIRSRETRLVKRCERTQKPFEAGHERMNRLVMRIVEGDWDPRLLRLETLWRDPATPTFAQKADATVKLVQANIIPVEQGREDLGYTAVQLARMREMDDRALDRAMAGDFAAGYGPKPPSEPPTPADPLPAPADPVPAG